MDKNIKIALDDLLKAIEKSSDYIDYKKLESEWTKAKESQKLLEDFLEARNTLNIFKQGNFPGIEEQQKRLDELQKKLLRDPAVNKWMDAQNNFQNFIWDQADYLTEKLKFNFSPKPRGGCCG